jgi:hypothetical protein
MKNPISGIPLRYEVGDITTLRASEMVVQANEHETIIGFFVVDPPIILGTPAQQAAEMKKHKEIAAKCVARVAIPTSKLQNFQQNAAQQAQPAFRMLPPHRGK